MLLAVNIGNTNIRFGVFEQEEVLMSWVINTKPYKTEDEYLAVFKSMYEQQGLNNHQINTIVIGSVVPQVSKAVSLALKQLHQLQPVFVDRHTPSAIQHSSNQMGTDLYANAVAAHHLYEGKKIIIDFGTALTFMCIDEQGKVQGVVIAPGISTSLKALIGETSQLTDIELVKPKSVLGLDTETCMQSGMVYGYLSMIEGMIERINHQINDDCLVVSTGGLGHVFAPLTNRIKINDKLHTIKGLMYLSEQNKNSQQPI